MGVGHIKWKWSDKYNKNSDGNNSINRFQDWADANNYWLHPGYIYLMFFYEFLPGEKTEDTITRMSPYIFPLTEKATDLTRKFALVFPSGLCDNGERYPTILW